MERSEGKKIEIEKPSPDKEIVKEVCNAINLIVQRTAMKQLLLVR